MEFDKLLKFLLLFLLFFATQIQFAFSHKDDDDKEDLTIEKDKDLSFGSFATEDGGTYYSGGWKIGNFFSFGGFHHAVFTIKKNGNTPKDQKIRVTIKDPDKTIESNGNSMRVRYQIANPVPSGNDKTSIDTKLTDGKVEVTIRGILTVAQNQYPGEYRGNFEIEAVKR